VLGFWLGCLVFSATKPQGRILPTQLIIAWVSPGGACDETLVPFAEPLFLYVAASKASFSAVLVREVDGEKGKHQSPIYFVSEALSRSKLLYSELEKIAYAVVMATRKLRHYLWQPAQENTILLPKPIQFGH
jgi:hypothetical protein